MTLPDDAHEWLSFEDDKEDRTWMIDLTFLESGWNCIFANGCQGVYTEPAAELVEGCCTYGAHFVDEDDVARVEKAAAKLTDEQWQFRKNGKKNGITKRKDGEITTRRVDGACLFLNRPGFAGGIGCALHNAAVSEGKNPMKIKPDVCWQLPLRREDNVDEQGHVISRVTEWKRRNWGAAGDEFHWWCTEDHAAFQGKSPVYVSLADELREMCGKSVYKRIAAVLDERAANKLPSGEVFAGIALPHPAVRRREEKRA